MKIVFATHNINKLKEVQRLLPASIQLLSLADINCTEEILETATTLIGNAKIKANYITKQYGYDCFADDTGLEVDVLEGQPGVYSARYAGDQATSNDNIDKLLSALANQKNRSAKFSTVIALNYKGKTQVFKGVCAGEILTKRSGSEGFGYDPVFKPKGASLSFAAMPLAEKNKMSHRAKAVEKLVDFFRQSLNN